jgi:hypothetical protein
VAAGYATPGSEGAQVQIRSTNTLYAALNGIWEAAMDTEQRTAAETWDVPAPDVLGAAAQLENARPRAPPARPPGPSAPLLNNEGWATKKKRR